MEKNFYITTTLPYVNADPHVGFAMEIIRADTIARYKMLQGYSVFFNTGTDEHGSKLYTAAQKEGVPVQQYVDRYAEKFRGLAELLTITPEVHFIRTTDEHHVMAALLDVKLSRQRENDLYRVAAIARDAVRWQLDALGTHVHVGKRDFTLGQPFGRCGEVAGTATTT